MARRSLVLLTAIVIAAVGVALIFVYVNRADERATAGQQLVDVYVVQKEIPQGTTLAQAINNGSATATTVSANVVDGVPIVTQANFPDNQDHQATAPILVKEILRLDSFTAPGGTLTSSSDITNGALAVQLGDPQRIASYLKPGIKVKIFASTSGEKASTSVLLESVPVLKVGSTGSAAVAPDPAVATGLAPQLVTIDVTPAEATQVITAIAKGNQLYMMALKG